MTVSKKIILEVDCEGHVSKTTFMRFLRKMDDLADRMFGGEVFIKKVMEEKND